jgi:hypothetical protein
MIWILFCRFFSNSELKLKFNLDTTSKPKPVAGPDDLLLLLNLFPGAKRFLLATLYPPTPNPAKEYSRMRPCFAVRVARSYIFTLYLHLPSGYISTSPTKFIKGLNPWCHKGTWAEVEEAKTWYLRP